MVQNVNSVGNRPFYTKNEAKRELKSAALSAGLSAGATFALNKGACPKTAGRVGLVAAAISLTLGAIGQMSNKIKANKAAKNQ